MMRVVFFKGIYLFVVFMCVCLHAFMCTRHVPETMEAIWMIVFESRSHARAARTLNG